LGNQPSTLARDDVLRRTVRSGTNPIGEPGAVLFRKSAAEKAGLFDGTCPFVIDLDYWLRLLEHGDAYYLPEYLSAFRISRQSHSVSLGARQAREFATFIESLSSNRGGPLGRFDVALGKASSRVQAIGRMAFQRYAMLLSRDINR
jgi:hypothetical protein